jgi:hypothetical protein
MKEFKCPVTDDWFNKLWYKMEYFAAIKSKEVLIHETM